MTSESKAARVKAIMVQVLDLDLLPEQIDDELSLYSSSIHLDSLSFLHQIIALEADFGCQIDDEDVMEADFETVASLIQLFEDKLVAAPIVSAMYHHGLIEVVAYPQRTVFEAGIVFAQSEKFIPAPESAHAIR